MDSPPIEGRCCGAGPNDLTASRVCVASVEAKSSTHTRFISCNWASCISSRTRHGLN